MNKAQTYTQYVKEIYMVSMILKSEGAWDNYKIMSLKKGFTGGSVNKNLPAMQETQEMCV